MAVSYGNTPDKGYAYVVLLAAFVSQILVHGVIFTVGVFYAIFVELFPESSGAVAIISSLNTAFAYGAGPFASFLVNKYGCRKVAVAGGVIGSSGLVLSMYATNVYILYATYGVMTGFGLGLAYLPSVTILGDYFEKWRPLAIAASTAGVGIGQFSHPPLIRYFLHLYGWRGTLLMIAGITFNLCVCGALFKPFKGKINSEINESNINCDLKSSKERNQLNGYMEKGKSVLQSNELVTKKPHYHDSTSSLKLTNQMHNLSNSALSKNNDIKTLHDRSLNNLKMSNHNLQYHGSVESLVLFYRNAKENIPQELSDNENTKKESGLLNLFMFKNPSFILICINNIGTCFGISVITVHLAEYAFTFGISKDKSAMLFTVMGLANFLGRISFGLLAQLKFTKHLVLYISAFITAGVATLICPLYSTYVWFIGYAAIFGFFSGCFGSLLPSIMIDLLDVQYLASAYGYLMVFAAIGTLLGAPTAGWLYDCTGVYSNSLYLAGAVIVTTTAILVFTLCCNDRKIPCSCCRQTSKEQYVTVVHTSDNEV